jgi:hypothetical protein
MNRFDDICIVWVLVGNAEFQTPFQTLLNQNLQFKISRNFSCTIWYKMDAFTPLLFISVKVFIIAIRQGYNMHEAEKKKVRCYDSG